MPDGGAFPGATLCLVFGVVLLAAGIVGFFYEPSFGAGDDLERDAVLGILDVNGWHNVVHFASGALALAVMGSYAGARTFAFGYGVVYVAVTILGFAYGDGDAIFDLIPINTEDNVLHLLIAIAAIGAGMATPARPAPTAARATN